MKALRHWFKEYFAFNRACNTYSYPCMLIIALVNLGHIIFQRPDIIVLVGLGCSLGWLLINLFEFIHYRKEGFFE